MKAKRHPLDLEPLVTCPRCKDQYRQQAGEARHKICLDCRLAIGETSSRPHGQDLVEHMRPGSEGYRIAKGFSMMNQCERNG